MKCKTCGQEVRELKVGDRVEATGEAGGVNFTGRRGVVKIIEHGNSFPVLVEFNKPIPGGHTGGGTCKDGHGWWGRNEKFKIIKAKKKMKKKLDRG